MNENEFLPDKSGIYLPEDLALKRQKEELDKMVWGHIPITDQPLTKQSIIDQLNKAAKTIQEQLKPLPLIGKKGIEELPKYIYVNQFTHDLIKESSKPINEVKNLSWIPGGIMIHTNPNLYDYEFADDRGIITSRIPYRDGKNLFKIGRQVFDPDIPVIKQVEYANGKIWIENKDSGYSVNTSLNLIDWIKSL